MFERTVYMFLLLFWSSTTLFKSIAFNIMVSLHWIGCTFSCCICCDIVTLWHCDIVTLWQAPPWGGIHVVPLLLQFEHGDMLTTTRFDHNWPKPQLTTTTDEFWCKIIAFKNKETCSAILTDWHKPSWPRYDNAKCLLAIFARLNQKLFVFVLVFLASRAMWPT